MLLAVAGLKEDEIKRRTRKLANGDWSDFTPAERQAFQFAHQLSRDPKQVSDKDVEALSKSFGGNRAIDLIWHIAWCNYMTRVADAVQFPLEQENVFAKPADAPQHAEPKEKP